MNIFTSKNLKLFTIILFLGLFLAPFSVAAKSNYVEGEGTYVFGELNATNTTWTASDSPYIVVGDVVVPEGKTLNIEPGAEVRVGGGYGIDVKGTIKAIGEKEDYITFTSKQEDKDYWDWGGIKLEETSTNNEIRYAIIEYARTALYSDHDSRGSVILGNSIIRKVDGGIKYLEDSEILHNNFSDIRRYVFYTSYLNTEIRHNIISNYHDVVFEYYHSNEKVAYNNIEIAGSDNLYIEDSPAQDFKNNYWGTTDEKYIRNHIQDSDDVVIKPYEDSFITFDLTKPEDDVLFGSSTSEIELQWQAMNGATRDLEYYQLYIDGNFKATTTATSISYDISDLSDGFHRWYVKAVMETDTYRSNNVRGLNIGYRQPHTPIATVSERECNQVETNTWCYGDIEVDLSADNSDFITYTLDGNEPASSTSSTSTSLYSSSTPISITATSGTSTILKAKSWKQAEDEVISSPLMTEEYHFDLTPPSKPSANPEGDVYEKGVSIELSSNGSEKIKYTTDGRKPTETSEKYTDSIQIDSSTVLKARALDEHGQYSKIMEQTYYIKGAEGVHYYPDYDADLYASLDKGAYISESGTKEVTLSANEETEVIRYTLDGSEVTVNSTEYDGAISIPTGTTTLRAKAWSQNGVVSHREINYNYFVSDHGTYISNNIDMKTTWSTDDSPYVVKLNSEVQINKKLVMKPGIEVIFNRYSELYTGPEGQIKAEGNPNNPIIISRAVKPYDLPDLNRLRENISTSHNSIFRNVEFNGIYLSLNNSSVVNSQFNKSKLKLNSSEARNNAFTILSDYCDRASLYIRSNSTFFNNNIDFGGELERKMVNIEGSNISIKKNSFNHVDGFLVDNFSNISFFEGVLTIGNDSGSNININKNNFNFVLSEGAMMLRNKSELKMDVKNNYWSTSSKEYIKSHIYDVNNDQSLGEVYYEPYAEEPLTFNLTYPNEHVLNSSSSITFEWEPLAGPESNVDHYKFALTGSSTNVSANVQKTSYTANQELPESDYEWYVKAIKSNGTEVESNQHLNFTVDNSVDKVTARPNEGTYIRPQDVTLDYNKNEATIRYTLDGREPTRNSSIYAGPINIKKFGTTTLKAKAWYNGSSSGVMTKNYYIDTNPPQITTSTVALAEENEPYESGTLQNELQGVVEEESVDEDKTVGLYLELNKAATCKYSLKEKEFSSIEGHWYNSEEGIFKSAHGTPKELIAPLGDLSNGNYKYFVTCSNGVDQTRMTFEFEKTATSVKEKKILDVTSVHPADTHAEATDSWEDGWQWVFDLTVPKNESLLWSKFEDWQRREDNEEIGVGGNLRYYSPQAATTTVPSQAILVENSDKYTESAVKLTKDANQIKPGRQIQLLIEMKIPEDASIGTYYTDYGIKSEKVSS